MAKAEWPYRPWGRRRGKSDGDRFPSRNSPMEAKLKKSGKQRATLSRVHLRTFVEPARLFPHLSFIKGGRARIACLWRLTSVGRSIHARLHADQRDGNSIIFCATTSGSSTAVKPAQATTPTTVSVEGDREEWCLTCRYNGAYQRHDLPESDKFESRQLSRRPLKGPGTSIVQRGVKDT